MVCVPPSFTACSKEVKSDTASAQTGAENNTIIKARQTTVFKISDFRNIKDIYTPNRKYQSLIL
jgi:hypothetical protein